MVQKINRLPYIQIKADCKEALIFLLTLWIGFYIPLSASGQQDADPSGSEYQNNVLYLPAIGSTPETGFMFGAVVVPQFKFAGAGPGTRSSNIVTSGIYTTKNQILFGIYSEIFFPGEKWVLNGDYYGNYFPESFWGIGPSTRQEDEMTVLYTEVNIEQSVLRQVTSSFFTGPYFRWNQSFDIEFEDPVAELPTTPDLTGTDGSRSVGFGWMIRSDRRNSNMTPTKNHFVKLSFLIYPEWAGSTHSFRSVLFDGRKYLDLKQNGRSVLAFQGVLQMVSGNPSFLHLSKLGGERINRGYYNGRYRDFNSFQFQTEYRQHIAGRIGFALFAATGEVWRRFENINLENYKWTAGAGLRINLNKHDTTNLRIDVGMGKENSGFYLQFGEAF